MFSYTVQKSLEKLTSEASFKLQMKARNFHIILYDGTLGHSLVQKQLLTILKFIFDRATPRHACVIFPHRTFRHPLKETQILLDLTSINTLLEGFYIWIDYMETLGNAYQCYDEPRRSRTSIIVHEMTAVMEETLRIACVMRHRIHEDMRDLIVQRAKALLSLFMEPLPFNFALNHFEKLMVTSNKAARKLDSDKIILQALTEVNRTIPKVSDDKDNQTVQIVVCGDTTNESLLRHIYMRTTGGLEYHNPWIHLLGLPQCDFSNNWQIFKASRGSQEVLCCYTDLLAFIESLPDEPGTIMKGLLLGLDLHELSCYLGDSMYEARVAD